MNEKLFTDLKKVINENGIDAEMNTPDGALAEYLMFCLDAYGKASELREKSE